MPLWYRYPIREWLLWGAGAWVALGGLIFFLGRYQLLGSLLGSVYCPTCRSAVRLVGRWACAGGCPTPLARHILQPCRRCGTKLTGVKCKDCGEVINPKQKYSWFDLFHRGKEYAAFPNQLFWGIAAFLLWISAYTLSDYLSYHLTTDRLYDYLGGAVVGFVVLVFSRPRMLLRNPAFKARAREQQGSGAPARGSEQPAEVRGGEMKDKPTEPDHDFVANDSPERSGAIEILAPASAMAPLDDQRIARDVLEHDMQPGALGRWRFRRESRSKSRGKADLMREEANLYQAGTEMFSSKTELGQQISEYEQLQEDDERRRAGKAADIQSSRADADEHRLRGAKARHARDQLGKSDVIDVAPVVEVGEDEKHQAKHKDRRVLEHDLARHHMRQETAHRGEMSKDYKTAIEETARKMESGEMSPDEGVRELKRLARQYSAVSGSDDDASPFAEK